MRLKPGWSTAGIFLLLALAGISGTALPGGGPPGWPLRFASEVILVDLQDDEMTVLGEYTFRNDGPEPIERSVHYPFFLDDRHPFPLLIASDGRPLKAASHGVIWTMSLQGNHSLTVPVQFSQRGLDGSWVYILTSTRNWQMPLERADFVIRYPRDWGELEVSYPADRIFHGSESTEYVFARTDFMPDRDLVIRRLDVDAPSPVPGAMSPWSCSPS